MEVVEHAGPETPASGDLALEGAEPVTAEAVNKGPKEEQAAEVCHLLQQLSAAVTRPKLATFVVLIFSAVELSSPVSTALNIRLANDSLDIMCLLTYWCLQACPTMLHLVAAEWGTSVESLQLKVRNCVHVDRHPSSVLALMSLSSCAQLLPLLTLLYQAGEILL